MTKLAFIYPPGQNPGRTDYTAERYNPHQEAIYQALSQAVYSFDQGRLSTLMPTPGQNIDMDDFEQWQKKALDAWKQETANRGRGMTRAIVKDDFPDYAWKWLYQRIRSAPLAPE
jgi:hypothetical protein